MLIVCLMWCSNQSLSCQPRKPVHDQGVSASDMIHEETTDPMKFWNIDMLGNWTWKSVLGGWEGTSVRRLGGSSVAYLVDQARPRHLEATLTGLRCSDIMETTGSTNNPYSEHSEHSRPVGSSINKHYAAGCAY